MRDVDRALRQAVDVESRVPPGVLTPGSDVTKSSALRLPCGSFRIWLVSIVANGRRLRLDDLRCRRDDDRLFEAADFERRRAPSPAPPR